MSKFILTAFQINECGCYIRGEEKASMHGNVGEVSESLATWVKSCKRVSDTKFAFSGKGKPSPIYASDIASNGSDYLVTLWLDRSNDGGQEVLGLDGSKPPNGKDKVESKNFGDEYIPGIPVYFYILPNHNLVYTVKPDFYLISGHPEFDAYMHFFITKHLGNNEVETNLAGDKIVKHVHVAPDGTSLNSRFNSVLKKGDQKRESFIKRVSEIRKVVSIRYMGQKSDQEKKSIISKLLTVFDLDIPTGDVANAKQARCEIDISLDKDSLEALIESAQPDEKIGFLFNKENKVHWTDQYIDRCNIDLEVEREKGAYNANDLLEQLDHKKSRFLRSNS